jgi:hypothetical protein
VVAGSKGFIPQDAVVLLRERRHQRESPRHIRDPRP